MRLTINGIEVEIDGWFYKGFISKDREEPDEEPQYIIDGYKIIGDYDGITDKEFQEMDYEEQLSFLGVEDDELTNICTSEYIENF